MDSFGFIHSIPRFLFISIDGKDVRSKTIDRSWLDAIDRTGWANARKHSYGPGFQYGTNINGSFFHHNDLWLAGWLTIRSGSGINEASKSRTALQPIPSTAQTAWRIERLPWDEQHTNENIFLLIFHSEASAHFCTSRLSGSLVRDNRFSTSDKIVRHHNTMDPWHKSNPYYNAILFIEKEIVLMFTLMYSYFSLVLFPLSYTGRVVHRNCFEPLY